MSGMKGEARKAEGCSEIHTVLVPDGRKRFKGDSQPGSLAAFANIIYLIQYIDTIYMVVTLYVVVYSS